MLPFIVVVSADRKQRENGLNTTRWLTKGNTDSKHSKPRDHKPLGFSAMWCGTLGRNGIKKPNSFQQLHSTKARQHLTMFSPKHLNHVSNT